MIDHEHSVMLLAGNDHGAVVGCARLEVRGPAVAYFGMLAVRPDLQNKGIGRALVERVEQRAKRDFGAREMTLTVISRRVELIAWYERLGYHLTGATLAADDPTTASVDRPDLIFTVMAKALAP